MNYNPTVDYRSDRVELPPESRGEGKSPVTDIATRGALSVALAVWAVIGFLLWIPLLLRRILSFVVSLTYVTLTNGDPAPAASRLRAATSFYRRGFETATRCVLSTPADGSDDPPPARKPIPARPVLQEIAWALVVWYPVLLWLGIAEWTPADVWQQITEIPWSETARASLEATATWMENLAENLAGRLGL